MAHVASNFSFSTTTAMSIDIPNSASVGDLAVIQAAFLDTQVVTKPSGWSTIIDTFAGNLHLIVLGKLVASSGEIGNPVNFTMDTASKNHIDISIISGVAATPETVATPVIDITTSTTRAGATATITAARQVIAGVVGRGNTTATNWTQPSAMTKVTQGFTSGTGNTAGARAYQSATGAGTVGTGNWVSDQAFLRAISWLLVLDPAATPLTTPVVNAVPASPTTPGGTDGSIAVSWGAISGAVRYSVEIATGLSATTGFTVVDSAVTGTTKNITGKAAGDYTVGVTAFPS